MGFISITIEREIFEATMYLRFVPRRHLSEFSQIFQTEFRKRFFFQESETGETKT